MHQKKLLIETCGMPTSVFKGFCTETGEDRAETLSRMKEVKFDMAFSLNVLNGAELMHTNDINW